MLTCYKQELLVKFELVFTRKITKCMVEKINDELKTKTLRPLFLFKIKSEQFDTHKTMTL